MPSGAHSLLIDHLYDDILASGKKPLSVDCGANIGVSVLWFAALPSGSHRRRGTAPDNFALAVQELAWSRCSA